MTTTTEVPGRYDVAIGGTGFMLQEDGEQPALVFQSLPQQREQQGGANANIGEQTVNPEGFWRRSRDGWYAGSGQTYGDRDESNPLRFRSSQGVDVFGTRHQLTLLHSLDSARTDASAFISSLTTADNRRVYFIDSGGPKYVAAPLTTPWTTSTVTGYAGTALSLAIDQFTLIVSTSTEIALGSTSGGTVATYVTSGGLSIGFAKSRLFAWASNAIYNITGSGALPAALLTLASGQFVGVCGASNFVYMGVAGSPSYIYKTTIKPDGTALDVPTVAAALPDGEKLALTARPLFSYLNRVFVATSLGIRMATPDDAGNLTFGSLIPITNTLDSSAWTAYDRFVWYGGSGSDTATRLDLTTEILPNTPAYASDITGGTDKAILGMTTFGGRRIISTYEVATGVSEAFVESATGYVTSGRVDSGLLALDLADLKTPVSIDVEGGGLDSTHTISEAISVDRGSTFTTVGTWDSQSDGEQAITGIAAARQFELRTTLTSSGTGTPTLYRHTLKTEPHVALGEYVILRLRLFEDVTDNTGARTGRTPNTDIALLQGYQDSREVIDLQIGSLTYTATLRDLQIDAQTRTASADDGSWNSVAQARFKLIAAT